MSLFDRQSPYILDLEPGSRVFICQCGHTGNPPFCDGTHKRHPGFAPSAQVVPADGKLFVCGCGHSARRPLCDGTHKKLRKPPAA
ncbi:iron-binding CDGSH zinc finger protein [Plasticicumulans lactativorans]|uniref:Iron-binding CDGSH zinc finger protein n=1 Tax=Plasticicumulans lactativorans TaxID=1133106 RepID=A0A4R2L2D1_9GAMM|nr:CDGSH iron-sulfur domain-containing protein [Plasticicumulans lactativorans]TCO80624.1 iron-binding CDGSH zinc finger protein [Plasticicumulans lactativorans]